MKHDKALAEALKIFAAQDPKSMAENSGAVYSQPYLNIAYFGQPVRIEFPSGKPDIELDQSDHLLIIQYLNSAKKIMPSGNWQSFLELPGGPNHYPPFVARGIKPLADKFGSDLTKFQERAEALSGEAIKMGDCGYLIKAFPYVNLAVCLWEADEEFEAEANILFDTNDIEYLTTAALYILGINFSFKMREEAIISG